MRDLPHYLLLKRVFTIFFLLYTNIPWSFISQMWMHLKPFQTTGTKKTIFFHCTHFQYNKTKVKWGSLFFDSFTHQGLRGQNNSYSRGFKYFQIGIQERSLSKPWFHSLNVFRSYFLLPYASEKSSYTCPSLFQSIFVSHCWYWKCLSSC